MPIYELGYRHWEGTLRPPVARVWAILRAGLSLALRSKMLKRLLFGSWMPLLYFAPLFFGIGYVTDPKRIKEGGVVVGMAMGFIEGMLGPTIGERLASDPESVRPLAWSIAFQLFFSFFQAFFAMLVTAIVGPPLISQDVRSKSFLLYFSKPITRSEYLLGKSGTLVFYLFMITLFPGLVLYLISISLSPNAAALAQTAPMILKITAASLVIAVPSTLLVLCFSSLTADHRYATVAWFAFCLMGEAAYLLFWHLLGIRKAWVPLFSLRETMRIVIGRILNVTGQLQEFGATPDIQRQIESLGSSCSPGLAVGYLAVLSAVCLAGLWRRISAPIRI